MAAVNKNAKETFELLRGSPHSDSDSDISDIVFPARKKRFRRRLKNTPSVQVEENRNCQCRAKTFILLLLCFVLICWLLTLTWLAFVLHGELSRLSSRVSKDIVQRVKFNMSLNSMTHVTVPLQRGKKMKKRKELDALVAKRINKRRDAEGGKRLGASGVSSHDKLLSESTDEQEYWAPPAGARPPRVPRRGYLGRRRTCSAFLKACSAILVFTCVVATTAVMWLFIDVREQVTSLRTELNQEVAGIQAVPEALQKCHTLSKDLQENQTEIMTRLRFFSVMLTNFTSAMDKVKSDLETVQDQLKSSPDLINNPLLVKELSASIASFGSQIKDLNATVATLKEKAGKTDVLLAGLRTNVSEVSLGLAALADARAGRGVLTQKAFAAEKEAVLALITQLSRNLSAVNDTLSNKLQWTAQDQSKDHNRIESLREMNENVTARVKTLEGLCAKKGGAEVFGGGEVPRGPGRPEPDSPLAPLVALHPPSPQPPSAPKPPPQGPSDANARAGAPNTARPAPTP